MSKTAIVIFSDGSKKPYEGVPDKVFNSPDGGESAILDRAKKDYPDKTIKTWGVQGKEQQSPKPTPAAPASPAASTNKQEPAPAAPAAQPDSAINDVVAQKQKDWEAKARAEQEAKAAADKAASEKPVTQPAKTEPAPTATTPAKTEPTKVEPAPTATTPAKTEPTKVEPTKTEPKPEEPAGPSLWDRIKGAVSGGSSSDKAPGAEAPAATTAPAQSAPAQQSTTTTSAPATGQQGAPSTGKDRLAAFKQRHGIDGGGAGAAGTTQSTGKEQGPGQSTQPGKATGVNATTSTTPGQGQNNQPGKQPGQQPGEAPGKQPGKKPGEGDGGQRQEWRPTPVKKGYWVDLGDGFRQWAGDSGVDPDTGRFVRSGTKDVIPVWKGDDDYSKNWDDIEELRSQNRLKDRNEAQRRAREAAKKYNPESQIIDTTRYLREQKEKLDKALKLGKK